MIGWIYAGGILLGAGLYDVKSRCLPWWLVIMGLLGGVVHMIYLFCSGADGWGELLMGLLPGALVLGLAFLTREQIGYGDGLLLLTLGCCLGIESTLGILMGGLYISFVVSLFLLVLKRAGRNTRIPFVPCLFLGYMLVGIGGIWQVYG